MVGGNHRRRKAWLKPIQNIKNRLSTWKGKSISIGGRVTLINAALNAIPSFMFSFYKAPRKVIKEIRGITSNFLWGGCKKKKCIHWVDWETVCKSKDKGGLGIRDVGEINKALLLKWKWRILTEDKAIWSRFIKERYVEPKLKVQGLYVVSINKFCYVSSAFSRTVLGACWQPTVFLGSAETVTEVMSCPGLATLWHNCVELLDSVHQWGGDEDRFGWNLNTNGIFSVASVSAWSSRAKSCAWQPLTVSNLKSLWCLDLPSRIAIFAWRFFVSRLPTIDPLIARGIDNINSLSCVFCGDHLESLMHLFFEFQVS
ncbi:uncharacterized protein LOC131631189 [Vicia villosa]|uniref:uncharacterized protein LOC131631189 n=1 Tax=Vicia villosa TaxID=3911 RepID=UPI00273AD3E6|nr:uncharacterized protein LOC131631189 [Vicia villosa]